MPENAGRLAVILSTERSGSTLLTVMLGGNRAVLERIEGLKPFYVWLVRHPLGVVASSLDRRQQRYLARRSKTQTVVGRSTVDLKRTVDRIGYLRGPYVSQKLGYWADLHLRVEAFLAAVPRERWLRIHFEELVRAPAEELEHLCAALGLELEPAMLRPSRNVPSALAWGLGNEKVLSHATIDSSVADRWREPLHERVLDKRTKAIMERLGSGT